MRLRFCAMAALALALRVTALSVGQAALVLCAPQAIASDVSSWSTTDANNNATPPNGWPSGTMLPSQVEPTGRAMMGAIARWFQTSPVANTTALRALATTSYPNGVWRATDGAAGAPPLFFKPGTAVCAVDNGATCVNSSDGKSWIGQSPGGFWDVRQFGVDPTGAADSAAAISAACNSANSVYLYFPTGTYKFNSRVTCTLATGKSITIKGDGPQYTKLYWPNAAGGLKIVEPTEDSYKAVVGLSLLTGTTDGGTALEIDNTATLEAMNSSALIESVTIQGNDGSVQTDYWTKGLQISNVSYISSYKLDIRGSASFQGIGIEIDANSTVPSFIQNFSSLNISGSNIGVQIGNWVQGTVISGGSNMWANTDILIPASETGLDQLTVVDSQFAEGSNGYIINQISAVPDLIVRNNLFITNSIGGSVTGYGIYLNNTIRPTIIGNQFININSGNNVGIYAGTSTNGFPGIISENVIENYNLGIQLNVNSQMDVRNNTYAGNTSNISSLSTGNTITTNEEFPTQLVTNVQNNGSGIARLTVGSTFQLYTGRVVLATAPGCTSMAQPVFTKIQVINSSTVDLIDVFYSGSSCATGGILTAE